MFRFLYLLVLGLLLAGPVMPQDHVLTLVTHDSFNVSAEVLARFEADTGITVEILRSGDAGTMVNQAILSQSNPLGDVLFGIDNTFLSRALNNDLFVPYESPLLANVPAAFILDAEHRVTPIDFGDVCLNYDIAYFEQHDLALPESLADLTDPIYKGLLAVQNPASSSPGLAFLLATVAEFDPEADYTYLDFWADLVANDVLVTDDWTTAYYSAFSAPGRENGDRPLVVSYASSPPVEFFFSEPAPEAAVTGAITADGTCFRQIEFAGILDDTDNLEAAQQFIDFLLSLPFQEDMPLQMFVYPVNEQAELPDLFVEYSSIPEHPGTVDYDAIDTHREEWIQAWTEVIRR